MKLIKALFLFSLFFLSGLTSGLYSQVATCGVATAIPIGSCNGAISLADNVAEGTTPAMSCSGIGTFKREGWFSFTTAGAQNITVTATSTTGTSNLLIQILSGACGAALSEIGCANNINVNSAQTEAVSVAIAAAGTYYIRIVNIGTNVAMAMSTICVNTTPANDGCAGATALGVAASCVAGTPLAGTIAGATSSGVAVTCTGANTANDDVWYSFIATTSSHAITVTPSASMNAVFDVFSTSCGTGSINCTNVNGAGGIETATLAGLTIGSTYWIRVYDAGTGIPASTGFSIMVETPPANDNCAGAISLTPSASCIPTTGCDYLATNSGLAACGTGTPDDDVWYSFVATGTSHTVQVTGNGGATGFDPVFDVYSACGGASLGCIGGGSPGSTQTFNFATTIGSTYYISVYDYGVGYPATNTFTICVLNPPPANDACGGAVTISPQTTCIVNTSQFSGDVSGATQTLIGCTAIANDDVWYTFTTNGTAGQPYNITVVGSASFDPVFEVFSTSCGGTSISCVNSTGTGGTESTTLSTLAVTTQYWVRVYDAGAGYPATTTFTICITLPPMQDVCPGLTLPVNVICSNTVSTMSGATSSGLAATCGGTPSSDVFFNFVATSAIHVVTVTPCAGMDPVIQVYSTSCGGTSINCTNANATGIAESAYLTALTVGSTYWVRVYDFNGTPGCFPFAICVSTPPANDICSGAVALTVSTVCTPITGNVAGATQSLAATGGCGNANDDVWYSFSAGATTQTVTVVGSASFNAVFELFSASCGGTSLGCTNSTGAGGTETATFAGLTTGATYWVRVYDFAAGYPGSTTFTICVTTPFNDFCNTAITVVCGGTYSGSTLSATYAGDPVAGCGGASVPNQGVWYIFAGTGQNVMLSMCGLGPNWDSEILVYSGSCAALTCVAGNDDNCPPTVAALSALTFGTVVGVNYYIFLGGWGGGIGTTTGTFTFTVTCVTPPVNDQCTGALTVQCGNTYSGNTTTASPNNDITSCGTATALIPSALWYTFLGDSTYLTISLCGSGFNTELGVWSAGSCAGPFTCVAGNNDFCGSSSQVTFMTTQFVTYYIEVYGFTVITVGQQTGAFTMTLTGGANPANPALTGCNPLPITLLSFTGQPEGAQNLLQWVTATETNNDYFTLEKSGDGYSFMKMAYIAGAGTSTALHSYSFVDHEPVNGITYYRLKQTDYNGAWTYSSIVSVENTRNQVNVFNIRPNPTSSNIDFDFFSSQKGAVRIQVLDYTGRIVEDETQNVMDGTSSLNARMSQLAKGIYSLKVSFSNGFSSVSKVVKQ